MISVNKNIDSEVIKHLKNNIISGDFLRNNPNIKKYIIDRLVTRHNCVMNDEIRYTKESENEKQKRS